MDKSIKIVRQLEADFETFRTMFKLLCKKAAPITMFLQRKLKYQKY